MGSGQLSTSAGFVGIGLKNQKQEAGKMPNRILKESICTSETIDQLTADEERFFYRLIVNCDDYGRLDARPSVVRSKLFPLKLDLIHDIDVIKLLSALVLAHLITVYSGENKYYLQLNTWEKHQQVRAKKSKYPAYNNELHHLLSIDNICNQMISDFKCNQMQSNVPVIQSNPIQSLSESLSIVTSEVQEPKKAIKKQANRVLSQTKFGDESLEIKLSKKLRDLIIKNNPDTKVPQNGQLQYWAKDMNKMLRLDKRQEVEISEVIEFSQSTPFWIPNILSVSSLRSKYDTLNIQRKQGGNKNSFAQKESENSAARSAFRDIKGIQSGEE